MPTANLQLTANSSQIRSAERDLAGLRRASNSAERATRLLTRAFISLGAALSVRQIAQATDAYTSMQNQLRIVTSSVENLSDVTSALNQVSSNTRSSIEATTNLYSRLARSTENLGLSQGEIIGITETINQAFATSGATAIEASNAITQLGQGLASGALRGDEFNSVAEQAPSILRAVSQETGLATGELRAFAAEGGITTELIISALQNYAETAEEEFASANATISQSTQQLSNRFIDLSGAFNEATNASGFVSDAILGISDSVDLLTDLIRSGEISSLFNAQFESTIRDSNNLINILNSEFELFFGGINQAGSQSANFIGDAFINIVPNVRQFVQFTTVEILSLVDKARAVGVSILQSLDPRVSRDDARSLFSETIDQIDELRESALQSLADRNQAERTQTQVTISESLSRIDQYRQERQARIDALSGEINGSAGEIDLDLSDYREFLRLLEEGNNLSAANQERQKASFESLRQRLVLEQTSLTLGNERLELERNLLALGESDGSQNFQDRVTAITDLTLQLQALRNEAELLGPALDQSLRQIGLSAIDEISSGLAGVISQGDSLRDTIGSIANTILNDLLTAAIRYFVGSAAQALVTTGATTAASVSSLSAIGAAATPAAIAVNIATLGAAATAATATAAASIPVQAGLIASSGLAGFELGGFTGTGGRQDIAGVVHGQEFVVNARNTARNRSTLEAMNRGEDIGGSNVVVNVTNNSSNSDVQTTESTGPNDERVIDIVVANIDQRGRIQRSITRNTTAANRI